MALEICYDQPLIINSNDNDEGQHRDELEDGEIEDDEIPDLIKEHVGSDRCSFKSSTDKTSKSCLLTSPLKIMNVTENSTSGQIMAGICEPSDYSNLNKSKMNEKFDENIYDEENISSNNGNIKNKHSYRTSKRKSNHDNNGFETKLFNKQARAGRSVTTEINSVNEEKVDEDEMIFVRGASPLKRSNCRSSSYHSSLSSPITPISNNKSRRLSLHGINDNYELIHCERIHHSMSNPIHATKRKESDDKKSQCFGKRRRKKHTKKEVRFSQKMEPDKFHQLDSRVKRNNCVDMHSEFPSKFCHAGFNHKPLTNKQNILKKYLETTPKEFPPKGLIKTPNSENGESDKKIPSLLDIKVEIPTQFLNSKYRLPIKNKYYSLKRKRSNLSDCISMPPMPSSAEFDARNLSKIPCAHDKCVCGLKESEKTAEEEIYTEKSNKTLNLREKTKQDKNDTSAQVSSAFLKVKKESEQENKTEHSLPSNLPKKQRELFLRIQQQQREAVGSIQEHNEEEIKTDAGKQTLNENWYSSDDEDASLTNVLKNLPRRLPSKKKSDILPPCLPTSISTVSSIMVDNFCANKLNETMGKLLCTIKFHPINGAGMLMSKQTKSNILQSRDPRLTFRNCVQAPVVSALFHNFLPALETNHTSIYRPSTALPTTAASSNLQEYSSVINPPNSGGGDVDFRRQYINCRQNNICVTSSLVHVDTGANPNGDTDLRKIMALPFNPVPIHKPATEIDASITHHPPIPYKLIPITIAQPNYTKLKADDANSRVLIDPRLHRHFHFPNKIGADIKSPSIERTKFVNVPSTFSVLNKSNTSTSCKHNM